MVAFIDVNRVNDGGGGDVFVLDNKSYGLVRKVPFALDRDLRVRFEGGADSQPVKGVEECFLSLPAGMLHFRVLELPLADMEKIRQVLPFELEGLVLGDPSDYVMDCLSLSDKRVLAVYVEKSVLKKLLDGLAPLGLEPRVVTAIDVGHAVRGSASADELTGRLLEGPALNGDERPAALAAEIRQSTVNLRRGELAWRKEAERARSFIKYSVIALIALCLIWTGDFAVRTASIKKESSRLESAVFKIYQGLFPAEKPQNAEDALFRMRAHLKEVQVKGSLLSGLRPLEVLLGVQQAAMPGVKVQSISMDKDIVVLKGEAPSLGDVQKVKESLAPVLNEVVISETGQSAKGKVSFTMTAKEKKP